MECYQSRPDKTRNPASIIRVFYCTVKMISAIFLLVGMASMRLHAQSFRPKDLYQLYNYDFTPQEKLLLKKGFARFYPTDSLPPGVYHYRNMKTSETVTVAYDLGYLREGGIFIAVDYYMPTVAAYKLFVARLTKPSFTYSKRGQCYVSPFESSYSGQIIWAKGKTMLDGKPYYHILFTATVGKELMPIPMPMLDVTPIPKDDADSTQ